MFGRAESEPAYSIVSSFDPGNLGEGCTRTGKPRELFGIPEKISWEDLRRMFAHTVKIRGSIFWKFDKVPNNSVAFVISSSEFNLSLGNRAWPVYERTSPRICA